MEASERVLLRSDLYFLKDHRQTDNREMRIKERAVSFLLKYQLKEILGLLIWNECHVRDGGPLFLCIKVLLSVSQEAPAELATLKVPRDEGTNEWVTL